MRGFVRYFKVSIRLDFVVLAYCTYHNNNQLETLQALEYKNNLD